MGAGFVNGEEWPECGWVLLPYMLGSRSLSLSSETQVFGEHARPPAETFVKRRRNIVSLGKHPEAERKV